MDYDDIPIIGLPEDRTKLFRKWYTRHDWGALLPRYTPSSTEAVSKVYFHFNTKTPPCYGTDECFPTIQRMQEEHIRKEMNDIVYNFLVSSGGNIYEGRGFGVLPSAHLRYAYGDRMDIAFIGEWTVKNLPYNMFKSGMILLQLGLEQGFVKPQWELEPIIPKKKVPKLELQMQRFLNREKNRKSKIKKPRYGRRRNFGGKHHVRQWTGI